MCLVKALVLTPKLHQEQFKTRVIELRCDAIDYEIFLPRPSAFPVPDHDELCTVQCARSLHQTMRLPTPELSISQTTSFPLCLISRKPY